MPKEDKDCIANGDRCSDSQLPCCPGDDGTKYMCDPGFQSCEPCHKDGDTCEDTVQCCSEDATCTEQSPGVSRCTKPKKRMGKFFKTKLWSKKRK